MWNNVKLKNGKLQGVLTDKLIASAYPSTGSTTSSSKIDTVKIKTSNKFKVRR